MTGTVSVMTIVAMAISCLAGFAIPVILFFFFRKGKNADRLPFFVGCGVMLLFALVLESAIHRIVLGSSVGETIQNNIWLYAIYGGLMAGLFEETGRFVAFKTVLRKKNDKDSNALMYGAGHGGLEAAVLLGISMLGNIVLAILMNSGNISAVTDSITGDALGQLEAGLETLSKSPSYTFLIGIMERCFAATLQIALSVIVWFAAKNKNRLYLYPAAVLIHCFVDALAAVLARYNVPILAVEAVICVLAALTAVFAKKTWNVNMTGRYTFPGTRQGRPPAPAAGESAAQPRLPAHR